MLLLNFLIKYLDDAVPLPEDEELNGFLPLEEAFNGLKFNNSSWESNKLPDHDINDDEIG